MSAYVHACGADHMTVRAWHYAHVEAMHVIMTLCPCLGYKWGGGGNPPAVGWEMTFFVSSGNINHNLNIMS